MRGRNPRPEDQRHEPAVVLDGDQVKGPSHRPREDDGALVHPRLSDPFARQPLGPSPERERGRGEDLGLDAGQVSDELG
jgi:hypothetical protein